MKSPSPEKNTIHIWFLNMKYEKRKKVAVNLAAIEKYINKSDLLILIDANT